MEYRTFSIGAVLDFEGKDVFEKRINEFAKKGWELHSVVPQISEGTVQNNILIFMRK